MSDHIYIYTYVYIYIHMYIYIHIYVYCLMLNKPFTCIWMNPHDASLPRSWARREILPPWPLGPDHLNQFYHLKTTYVEMITSYGKLLMLVEKAQCQFWLVNVCWVSVAAKKLEVSLQVSGKEVTPSCEESHQWHDFVGGLRFCMSFIDVCPSLLVHWCILFSSRVVLQFCFMDVENLPKQNQHGIPLFLQTKPGIIAKSNPEAQNHLVWVSFWAPINPLN